MAHSIQQFRGQFVTLNDLDIIASVAVLREIAREQSDDELSAILTRWDCALQVAGPGTIDLNLDKTIRSAEEHQGFLRVLDKLRMKVDGFGETISASILNRTIASGGAKLNDYPSYLIVGVANALEKLVR